MAFNLQEFKADIGGGMKSHSYEVFLKLPPIIASPNSQLRLKTESVTLPGASFMSVDNYRPRSSGLSYTIPYAYNRQEIACSHLIDTNGSILTDFNRWVNFIVDTEGIRQYTANYHKHYCVDMTIKIYDPTGKSVKTYTINDAHPLSVDQVQMSWGSNDEIARLNVTYSYTQYKLE